MDSVRTSDSRKIIFISTQVWSKARKLILAGTPIFSPVYTGRLMLRCIYLLFGMRLTGTKINMYIIGKMYVMCGSGNRTTDEKKYDIFI